MKTDTTLQFLHRVLHLDHLHFGLWEDGDSRDRVGLRNAQQRYVQKLVEWIPSDVRSILDVGCGVGATTEYLAHLGYDVEGLSPDPYQREVFERRLRRLGVPFHLVRFPDFAPRRTYDLVLMSESVQYIWLDGLFRGLRLTAPGGWLLVSDYFVVDPDLAVDGSGHQLEKFLRMAETEGLELVRRDDVTEVTAPTLELAERWVERYVLPTLNILCERYPRASRIVRRLLPHRRLESLRATLDSERYVRAKRYLFLLYRLPGGKPERDGGTEGAAPLLEDQDSRDGRSVE